MKVIFAFVMFYCALLALVYLFQDRLIYFPDSRLIMTPREIGLEYEDVVFQAEDGVQLAAWYVPSQKRRGVVLFCHGNGGNISYRCEYLKVFSSLGLDSFVFDYRGYGKSRGKPSEEGTYLDALGAWNYLTGQRGLAPQKIIVYGESLGGAVAAWLARERNPGALVLQSAFTSLPDIGADAYPFLPARLLARYRYATKEYLSAVGCPVLIIHSRDDEIVPFKHGLQLHAAAPGEKSFIELRGDHNGGVMISLETYRKGMDEFLGNWPSK